MASCCNVMPAASKTAGMTERSPSRAQTCAGARTASKSPATRSNIARKISLEPLTTPVESPQSNGMAEAFVRAIKRDDARVLSLPDAKTAISLLLARVERYKHSDPRARELPTHAGGMKLNIACYFIITIYLFGYIVDHRRFWAVGAAKEDAAYPEERLWGEVMINRLDHRKQQPDQMAAGALSNAEAARPSAQDLFPARPEAECIGKEKAAIR